MICSVDLLRTAYWCERPELFAAIADAKSDEERSVAVLKWFIVSATRFHSWVYARLRSTLLQSTLKGQYTSRNEKLGSEIISISPVAIEADSGSINLDAEDEEALKVPPRPFVLSHSIMIGLAMCLLIVVESLAIRQIVVEIRLLGSGASLLARFA